jgi:hypothetical protein
VVLVDHRAERQLEELGLGGLGRQRLQACLHGGHLVRVLLTEVFLFARILVRSNSYGLGGERRAPDQLPVPFAQGGTEGSTL